MKLKLRDIVVIDFETYYSNDYSLKKREYNTSKYVWDPQFKVQCVAIRDGLDKEALWYDAKDAKRKFRDYAVASRPVVAHNTAFDGFILSQHYGIVPPYYLDTLSMARALHGTLTRNDLDTIARLYGMGNKKPNVLRRCKGTRNLPPDLLNLLGEYCAIDADLCWNIMKLQLKNMPDRELDLIDWTIRCFCDPVLMVDQKLVKEEYDDEVARKTARQTVAGVSAKVLQSAELFAEALRACGVEPPTKTSKTTGEITYAFAKTDYRFTDLLNYEDNPMVARLVEARLATKSTIGETRALRFMDIGDRRLPVGLGYCAAHTTRWGGNNKMNLQNLERPSFDEKGQLIETSARLRRSIIAPPRHVIGVADSAQIEARLNAWISGHDALLEIFRASDRKEGPDPYRVQAAATFGKDVKDITKEERFIGKIQTLGLGFKMGAPRLRNTLALGLMGPAIEIDDRQSQQFVFTYRSTNAPIVAMWGKCGEILIDLISGRSGEYKCIGWEDNTVWLPSGLGLHYNFLMGIDDDRENRYSSFKYFVRNKPVTIYDGLLLENIVQGLARCVIARQLLAVETELRELPLKRGETARVASMTHDELIAVFPERLAEQGMEIMLRNMTQGPKWAEGLPLAAEGGFDVRYSK